MTESSRRPGALPWALSILILIGLRLWLTSTVPVALLDHDVDDSLYLRHAAAISSSGWLGEYDHNLLVKGPGYGAFLALAMKLDLTRRTAEDLLQILAALVMLASLRRLGVPMVLALPAFALLVFHPACIHGAGTRVAREGVYLAQTVLVLALAGALIPRGPAKGRLALATVLGVVLAWSWQTRGEGVWFLPPLALCGVGAVIADRAAGVGWKRSLGTVSSCGLVIAAVVVVGNAAVARLNDRHHGAPVTNELKDGPFNAAVGALQRVADSRWSRYEPLSSELRAALAAASPAYAEISPLIEKRVRKPAPSIAADDGEMMAIFFSWALRDAAAEAGHHATLPRSRAFYARLAAEINAACDAGRLPGGAPRTGQTPRLEPALLGTFARLLRDHEQELLTPRWLRLAPDPPLPLCLVEDKKREVADSVLGEPLVGDGIATLHRRWSGFRILATASRQGTLVLRVLGLALILGLLLSRRGRVEPALWFAVALEVALLTRTGLVAALETWWFRDVAIYLVPVAPLGGLVGLSALGAFVRDAIPRRRVAWLALGVTSLVALVVSLAPDTARSALPGSRLGGDDLVLVGRRSAIESVATHDVAFIDISHAEPLEVHVVAPRAPNATLVVDAGGGADALTTVEVRSWRFDDGVVRPVVHRRFLGNSERVLRIPVSILPTHPLVVGVTEDGGVLAARSIRLEWTVDSPPPAASLRVETRGDQLEVSVEGGVPGGVYVVFFAGERMPQGVRDPLLNGAAHLDPSTTISQGGSPVRVVIVADDEGLGRTTSVASIVTAGAWAQGLGEGGFTKVARVVAGD